MIRDSNDDPPAGSAPVDPPPLDLQPLDLPPLDLEVLSGRPTDAEIAAVTAVLSAAFETSGERRRVGDDGPSGWERSQRGLRKPIQPGPRSWTGFTV